MPAPPFFQDSDLTVADVCGPARISFPFEGDSHAPTHKIAWLVPATNPTRFKYQLFEPDPSQNNSCSDSFILEQDFQQSKDAFSALAIGTAYDAASFWPDYDGDLDLSRLILVSESPTSPAGQGGIQIRWTRTYATIPPPRNTYESFVFTFPGLFANHSGESSQDILNQLAGQPLTDGAPPVTAEIVARVEHIYFQIDGPYSPNITDLSQPDYIIPAFRVFFATFVNEQPNCFGHEYTSTLSWTKNQDGTPATLPMPNTIPPLTDSTDNASDSGVPYAAILTPSQSLAGLAEICVKQSIVRPWRGNIYEKITLFALAQ